MAKKINFMDFSVKALIGTVVGGLLAFIGGNAFGLIPPSPAATFVTAAIVIFASLFVANKTKKGVDDLAWFPAILQFGLILAFGELIVSFVPGAATFILAASQATLTGLFFTLFYVISAQWLGEAAMKR